MRAYYCELAIGYGDSFNFSLFFRRDAPQCHNCGVWLVDRRGLLPHYIPIVFQMAAFPKPDVYNTEPVAFTLLVPIGTMFLSYHNFGCTFTPKVTTNTQAPANLNALPIRCNPESNRIARPRQHCPTVVTRWEGITVHCVIKAAPCPLSKDRSHVLTHICGGRLQ